MAASLVAVPLTIAESTQGKFALSITVGATQDRDHHTAQQIITAIKHAQTPETVQLWIEQASDQDDQFASTLGFTPYRDLWRMQRTLPTQRSTIRTRAFVPDKDNEACLEINNRAFYWHPEQGDMTNQGLLERMSQGWFDPEGFRLYEQDGRLVGFCWTKTHLQETPPAGEVYAIAVDPNFHGKGLGKQITLSGLDYLSQQGLKVGFLYVESNNETAVAVYSSLGFAHHSTNRAYRITALTHQNVQQVFTA
ncbi:MAG: mycothiol synthase [Acidimicrobiia bacterium]|nr:mycothiol synthase [Acidimicrobiia bacterium]MYC57004.1 mycothiol synthase [Acidimicrobiia bacterium]MYI30869.1 mycothiol synthase [Acidimicrobiia bacterium]